MLLAATLGTIGLAPWSEATHEGPGTAHITGSFSDDCTDFDGESDKDISNIQIFWADGGYEKIEPYSEPTFSIDGDREIDKVIIKSGRTSRTFTCDGEQPECSDGEDNADPEDTLIDEDDPGCDGPDDPDETDDPECSDGEDNADPEDTIADFPADPGCENADDDDETDAADDPECSDGEDNADPEDTLVDENDPGCLSGTGGTYDPDDDDETDPVVDPAGTFGCRASVARVDSSPLGLIEPFVANEPGEPCAADNAGIINQDLGPLHLTVVDATTGLPASAESTVVEVILSNAGVELIRVTVLKSEATGSCAGGNPTLSGSSVVAGLVLGQPIGEISDPIEIPIPGLLTVYLNYQETSGNTLIQRAVYVDVAPALEALVGDITVAESVVSYSGNPCS